MSFPLLIYKAQSISDLAVPSQEIIIGTPFPDGNDLRTQQAIMRKDAEDLVNALRKTLPQGTWAQFIAIVAREWAADQYGVISAADWSGPARKEQKA